MNSRTPSSNQPRSRAAVAPAVFALAGLVSLACTGDLVDDPSLGASSGLTLGPVNVLTRNYNNQRTGANLQETVLNHGNVNASQFGKLFQVGVDDQVYAGILYASQVPIAGVNRNVIYVATVNNTVYAFNADVGGSPIWQRNFNGSGRPTNHTEVGTAACGGNYADFSGNIGIIGTPVIDGGRGVMYFVTRTVEGGGTVQRLRAVNITTGGDPAGVTASVTIAMTVPGTGDGSSGGNVPFNAVNNNQRPALALSQGIVYVGWSSFCDQGPFHGWLAGYDGTTLGQVGKMATTPNGGLGGIWMSGAAPVVDGAGNLYAATGNGSWDGNSNFGESLLKLSPGSLARTSFFTPGNWATLNSRDDDLGSGGCLVLPGLNSIVVGSKEGKVYLMPTSNLGGMVSGDTQIPQWFQAVSTAPRPGNTHHIHNGPVAWNSQAGLNLYVWGENDFLRVYRYNTGTARFNTTPQASGTILPPVGMPGGMLALSANGSTAGTGILWAAVPRSGDANHAVVPGILRAFNAETAVQIWDSSSADNDQLNFAKYNVPVVANGRVYVGSFSNSVSAYGLRTLVPFKGTRAALPGTIEAENFDFGGEGLAYHDTDVANQGGANLYRTGSVDLQATGDTGGGFNVGWIAAGEWLKYAVSIAQAGTYNLGGRYASGVAAGGSFRIELDGADISGVVTLAGGTSWTTWRDIPTRAVALPAGNHTLTLFAISAGGFNLNKLTFTQTGGPPPYTGTPFGGTRANLPGTVQAENFDEGGENVAYHDTEAVNQGPTTTRAAGSPGVDLQPATDTGGGVNVGWIGTDEWLRYSINVTTAGTYTVTFRVASGATVPGKIRLEVDGTDVTGDLNVNPTGGWQTWTNLSRTGVSLTAGNHLLRVFFANTGLNLNSFSVQ